MSARRIVVSAFLLVFTIINLSCQTAKYQEGSTYSGFKLVEKRFVKEVNSECLYFEHVKSGARLLKISADDPNKAFCITFKTTPETDSGTPHIMEHSVLNGSKNFPVKSPFDVLAKGSLNTFLNAMTGGDLTLYPIASMNDKDYFNLMHVYLDAVFNPLIYSDPRILQQEGWHYELTDKDSPIVYKGVVYNEMKGAFSSPTRELDYQINKILFPDNCYGKSSGGYPAAIPELTYEKFLDFHRKYYHPSNSYIFLYGDADIEKELSFIDENYLSNYEKSKDIANIPMQKPFERMKKEAGYYPALEDSDIKDRAYLTLNWVIGKGADQDLSMALDILTDALVNHESGPVRLALQEANIGRDVRASSDAQNQISLQIRVQDANSADIDKFYKIVMKTLQETIENGIDREIIKGIINRMEFQLREGDTPNKGLTYLFQAIPGWLYVDDPFLSLEWEKPLSKVKKELENGLFESIVKEHMVDNPHCLLYSMEPKPGLERQKDEKSIAECADYKSRLGEEEKETLIKQTKELVEYQERDDAPEALATIPLLDLKDINPKAVWYDVSENSVAGVPELFYDTFTNDIVYCKFLFDVRVLPQDMIPYVALFAEVLGSMNTENYTFGELDNELNIHTGGFDASLSTYLKDRDTKLMMPKFVVSSKAMSDKTSKLFELSEEILNHSNLDDKDRLKTVLVRHQSRLEADVKQNGLGYARTRLSSYYSDDGMYDELTGGAEYYWFVTNLVDNFDKNADLISTNLQKVALTLFNKNNMIVSVTCGKTDLPGFEKELEKFSQSLSNNELVKEKWEFDREKKNEGFLTTSKVQYVLKGFNFKDLGYQWDGTMLVMNQILSREWLTNQVRVIGGAYGGFSNISPSGQVYFASYRDPNLKETLDNFDASPEFLAKFDPDEDAMTRFIIGTISRMDRPLTPSGEGNMAVTRYLEKTTKNDIQTERDKVIATTPEDIQKMEKFVCDILDQNAICVYGNEEKVKANKDLFKEIIKLGK